MMADLTGNDGRGRDVLCGCSIALVDPFWEITTLILVRFLHSCGIFELCDPVNIPADIGRARGFNHVS